MQFYVCTQVLNCTHTSGSNVWGQLNSNWPMTLYDGNEAFTKEVKNKNWHLKLYYNSANCRNIGKEQRIEGACGVFVKDLSGVCEVWVKKHAPSKIN